MVLENPGKRYIVPEFLGILLFSSFFILFDWAYSRVTILLICVPNAVSMMILKFSV